MGGTQLRRVSPRGRADGLGGAVQDRRSSVGRDAAWWAVGLTAGLLAGLLHTAIHGAYAAWVNPDYLESFASWNAATTANTLEVARREFSLPGFMDVLVGHQLAVNLAMAWATSKRLM